MRSMLRFLHRVAISALLLLSSAGALQAQGNWSFNKNEYDLRLASVQQSAEILGSRCQAYLQFQCAQDGKDATGMMSLHFTVAPSSGIRGFDFGYFEGPGADVGTQKLMRVTLFKGEKPTVKFLGLAGWLSAEVKDGFVFGSSSPTRNRNGQIRKILDQILMGADSIEIAILEGKNHSRILAARFPLAGSKTAIEQLLKGIK